MSVGTSPSGVASLRARFEQKDEASSPPSRGRSPAASLSVTGDISRPISKVRTSFVAVEPSGQMGDLDASEELGSKGYALNGDGAGDSATNGAVQKPKTNGIELTPQNSITKEENAPEKSIRKEENAPEQTTPESDSRKQDSTPPNVSEVASGTPPAADPDQAKGTAVANTPSIPSSDPNEAAAVPNGAAQKGKASPLGSILKGSPFEQDEKKGEELKASEPGASLEPAPSLEQQANGTSTSMTNGKPKEALTQKAGVKSKSKTTPRPSAIGKNLAARPVSSTTRPSVEKPQRSTPSAPTTPKSTTTPSKQSFSKTIVPKPAASQDSKKEEIKDARKTTAERPSRLSVASKAPAAASKLTAKPKGKPGPTSPPSFTKPRPKSPTRPVRLPSSATAPTAASTAKLDAASAATAKPRDRIPSNPISLRPKPARTSLPAGSKPVEKAKPKSRLSTVSSKAPEGSFLDRMMRPTQSSSQKTHEKVEVKTPPKKTNGVKPKRKSDGSEKVRSENVVTEGEQSMGTAPSTPTRVVADSSEISGANGANKGIDEPTQASSAPLPVQ